MASSDHSASLQLHIDILLCGAKQQLDDLLRNLPAFQATQLAAG
jgi:hypothetical protein